MINLSQTIWSGTIEELVVESGETHALTLAQSSPAAEVLK